MFQSNPKRAALIAKLRQALSELPVGDMLTYPDAHRLTGVVDRRNLTELLGVARRLEERETSARFSAIWNTGIKRLTAEEIAGIGSETRNKIAKRARVGVRRLSDLRVNFTPEEQARVDAERSLLGAIAALSSVKERPVDKPTPTPADVAAFWLKK